MRQLKITPEITQRDFVLEKYLSELQREATLITPEEEVRLAKLIKQGDKKAEDKLVKANLLFVVSVAKKYQSTGVPLKDLINDGNLGLIKAAKMFDETKGFKFISYAVWWIRQSIMESLPTHTRIVRLPGNKLTMVGRFKTTLAELEQVHQRTPSMAEVCEKMNISQEVYLQLNAAVLSHSSLEKKILEDESTTFLDVLPDDEINVEVSINNLSLKESVLNLLKTSCLTPKEQEVITLFYGIGDDENPAGLSLEEIGQRLGYTRERIRQIREKALKRLGRSSKAQSLKHLILN